ncbi:MAG TPA: bifunctional methylenetetrahydrofolate dehydrogenase/methenyltetrahydrofolate cyclohydrolase FolD [Clostridiales bacterium]|nr:bifunctional methylenetetrahydrofolate dehydrogenase/methenyltetrahydrofolate cyclohydrolase FolD [Clostridiales bacterium]
MKANIIDGKAIAKKIREDIRQKTIKLKEDRGIIPGLTVILVGDDPASQIYVRNKEKSCRSVGINSNIIHYDSNISQDTLLKKIYELNEDEDVHGILVQLPLPKHIKSQIVLNAIDPQKDVDGFHPVNVGKLVIGEKTLEPCTAKGIIYLIEETGIEIEGKHAVVIGRSNIVGKPVSLMLLHKNATVTMCHSKTEDLKDIARQADILVVAVGNPEFIDGSYIKEGAVVIDVGTSRVNNKLYGDIKFEEAVNKAGWITPVPGGVGPMTIAMLLENTLYCAQT